MSLIETAVQKAKKLADSGRHRVPGLSHSVPVGPEAPARSRRSKPRSLDEAGLAELAARARTLPVAEVDAATMERHGLLPQVQDAAAHRAYRILRTRVHQRMQMEGWHSIAVTSAGVGDGKTLTAINLAISLARDPGTWVWLVDLDLQRHAVASYMGLEFDKGLSDYLAGVAGFEEILYSPGIERLCVVPNRQALEFSSDLLATPRINELCDRIAQEVPRPVVIYDMPPLLLSDDVLKFSPNFDCALFVASEGCTSRTSLERIDEALQDIDLLGVVLNRSTEREEGGYY